MNVSVPPPAPRRARPRKATNLSVRPELVEEARALGINLSDVLERALQQALSEARAAAWLDENLPALESSNAWVAANGLPLAAKRRF